MGDLEKKELIKVVEEGIEVYKTLKMKENTIKSLKDELKKRMEESDMKRIQTSDGVAFFSSGSSVRIDKKKLYQVEKLLKNQGIEPDYKYRKRVTYVRFYVDEIDEVPLSNSTSTEAMIKEIIKLNAEISILRARKKEITQKIISLMKRIGADEVIVSEGKVKLIEYEKDMIDYEKLKEKLEMLNIPEEVVFKKNTYEKFVVVDWAAYQKMLEHVGGE